MYHAYVWGMTLFKLTARKKNRSATERKKKKNFRSFCAEKSESVAHHIKICNYIHKLTCLSSNNFNNTFISCSFYRMNWCYSNWLWVIIKFANDEPFHCTSIDASTNLTVTLIQSTWYKVQTSFLFFFFFNSVICHIYLDLLPLNIEFCKNHFRLRVCIEA